MKIMTVVLALVFMPMPAVAASSETEVVQEFVAAFNAQDVERMLAVAHEDIEWFYLESGGVEGGSIHRETSGKAELRKAMTDYFASCPSCRSSIEIGNVHGAYLSVLETASWRVEGEERSQSSLAVYRIEDGKVRSVWYYPGS